MTSTFQSEPMTSAKSRQLVCGAVLWVVILILPTIHIGLNRILSPIGITFLFLPLAVLAKGIQSEHGIWLLFAYPLSLVPALLLVPALIGPDVYGWPAFIALTISTIAYVQAAANPQPMAFTERDSTSFKGVWARASSLNIITLTVMLCASVPLFVVHFDPSVRYRLADTYGQQASTATVCINLLFLCLWTWATFRLIIREIATFHGREKRQIELFRFQNQHLHGDRVKARLYWTLITGSVFGWLLLLWLTAGSSA